MATSATSTATEAVAVTTPIVRYGKILIRPYTLKDAPLVAVQANNPKIARYLRNRFPSPYTEEDAVSWIDIATKDEPLKNFALCTAEGTYIGGIGLITGSDVEHRTWEIGYWVGESFWGQGLATDAAVGFSKWAFETFPELMRLEAGIFEGNVGSQKVLAKAGYTFEGRRRKAVEKNGIMLDLHMYSLLREECLKE